MKATRKGKIKQKYGFEAPIFPAKASKNENYEINDIETNFNIYSMLKGNIRDYFLVRVNGESMQDIGISDGDTLVVNSKINALSNDIVIASLNGELLVKTLKIIDDKVYLISQNEKFLPIEIFPEENFKIHGIVELVIHNL
jgi:DNA polymerase V